MRWIERRRRRPATRRPPGRPRHPDVLTPAEWRVLELVREGHTNPEIAARLGVSLNTVKTQVSSMLAKLELHDRAALAAWHGEPEEASRSALARLAGAVAAPLGWLREAATSPAAGKAALVGSLAALSVAAIVGLAHVGEGGGVPSEATPTPPPAAAPTEEPGDATPVPDGFPLEAPDPGYAGVGLVDGLPPGAVGPLVVYVRTFEVWQPTPSDPADPPMPRRREIEVFDLGSGQPVSSFRVAARRTVMAELAGDRVLVSFGRSLWSYALDGSGGVELWGDPDRFIERLEASPDGRLVAIGEGDPDGGTRILDARTGDEVLFVAEDEPRWGELRGNPGPDRWLSDHALLIWGWTYSHQPGGSAILRLDGSVDVLAAESRMHPDREVRVEMEGRLWAECALGGFAGATALHLISSEGEVLEVVQAAGPLLGSPDLAPDSGSLIYRLHTLDRATLEALLEHEATGTCLPSELEQEVIAQGWEWRLRDLATGEDRAVDRLDAFREWYGDRTISYACQGEELAGLTYPLAQPPGTGTFWGFSDPRCGHEVDSVELRIGGQPVARGVDFEVLGFVEVP